MKKTCLYGIIILLLLTLVGCTPNVEVEPETTEVAIESQNENTVTEVISTNETEADAPSNQTSAYQFLNLMLGNAEDLTISYHLVNFDEMGQETVFPESVMYKKGDMACQTIDVTDMDGNVIKLKEIERDGYVYYYLEDTKKMYRYLAPADDFIYYQMMAVTVTPQIETYPRENYNIFVHQVASIHDASDLWRHEFFMKNDALDHLDSYFNNSLVEKITFTEWQTDTIEDDLFLVPQGYEMESFDCTPSEMDIPPWWDSIDP